ncbi:MAG: hypothetical protein VW338_00225 [Rhodospirillaceae bacterium]
MAEPNEAAAQEATQQDAAATAAAETAKGTTTGGADDLEGILSTIREYREETASPGPTTQQREPGDTGQRSQRTGETGGSEDHGTKTTQDRLDPNRVEAIERRIIRDDVNRAIETMRSAQPALKTFDGDTLEAYLNAQATRDPRIRAAWLRRDADPGTFQKVVTGLARRMASGLPAPVDASAAGERGAAVAAARGATQQQSAADLEDAKVLAMSDREFDQLWNKLSRRA